MAGEIIWLGLVASVATPGSNKYGQGGGITFYRQTKGATAGVGNGGETIRRDLVSTPITSAEK